MSHEPIEFPIVGGFARDKDAKAVLLAYEGGEEITFMPEPDNPYDEKAVKCIDKASFLFVGYVPRTHNELVLEALREHPNLIATVLFSGDLKPLVETTVPNAKDEDKETGA